MRFENISHYKKLHRSYLNQIDLLETRIDLYQDQQKVLHDKYLLDKILHNRFNVSSDILKTVKPRVIFLLREPKSTLESIINMGYITGIEWYKNPHKALKYYASRLLELEKYATEIEESGGNYFFIESDHLISNTDEVLNNLTEWLNLNDPLDKNYNIFNKTGKRGSGDPSENIKSGVIKRTSEHHGINIPLEILQEGELIYEKCKSHLQKHSSK